MVWDISFYYWEYHSSMILPHIPWQDTPNFPFHTQKRKKYSFIKFVVKRGPGVSFQGGPCGWDLRIAHWWQKPHMHWPSQALAQRKTLLLPHWCQRRRSPGAYFVQLCTRNVVFSPCFRSLESNSANWGYSNFKLGKSLGTSLLIPGTLKIGCVFSHVTY